MMESLLRMEVKVINPQSSAGAGARTESLGKLKEEQLKAGPKEAQHRGRCKSSSDRRSARRARREGSSESNRTNFYERGAAWAENLFAGLIRVH